MHFSTNTVTPTVSFSITKTTTTGTTSGEKRVQSCKGQELTFRKPLICSPARKGEGRIEEGVEKEGMEREKSMTEQEEERAFTVSKRKAAITEPPS